MRIVGGVSWPRILVVGTWLAIATSVLIWAEGPFWYDGVEWFRQAQDAAVRGDWRAAVANVERAREAEPDHGGLATFEGHARLRLGEPSAAAEAFREARTLAPGDVEPLLGLAEARLDLGDTATARAALEDAASLAAVPPDRVRLAGMAEAAGDPGLALDVLMDPPPTGTLSHRIRLARELERWSLAVELLREALAGTTASGPGAGSPPEDASDPAPETVERRRQLAWALRAAGRDAEALEEYRALADAGARDAQGAMQHAWILNEAGRHEEALAVLDRFVTSGESGDDASARAPSSPASVAEGADPIPTEVTDLRIRTALWAGRVVVADRHLSAALQERPGDPELLQLRGAVVAARARLAAARAEARARAEADARTRAEATARAREEAAEAEEEARRAARGTPPDDREAALDFWTDRLEESPADSVAREEAIALLESFQRFDRAAQVALDGRGIEEVGDPVTLLHLARLGEWGGSPRRVIASLERYEELRGEVPTDHRLPLARAYEATGDDESALLAYGSYLEDRSGDLQVRLGFARFLAGTGRLERSREAYAGYRDAGGPEPVALERARVELGLGRYPAAVEAARDAVREADREAGPDHREARLVLAEALRYDGRRDEAEALLEELARTADDPVGSARVALLRGRPLAAIRALEGASTPESILLRARAAMDAGQWARARAALGDATEAGADDGRLASFRERLDRQTASSVSFLASAADDDVRVSQRRGGAAAEGWLAGDRLRVRSTVESVSLSQGPVDRELLAVTLGGDSLVLGDATSVGGGLGARISRGDGVIFSGAFRALRRFEDGSSLSLDLDRAPVWESTQGLDPLRYSRVRELGAMEIDLAATDLTLGARKGLGIGRSVVVDAGLGWYSDGNRRSFAYGHVELPLETRVGRWIGLQPNAYVEWFDRQASAYASPSRYVAAGVRAVGAWEGEPGSLRVEANPHLFDFPGETGIGLDARIEATRDVGPVEVVLQGFYTGQEGVYGQYGASLGVRLIASGGTGGAGGFGGSSGGP